MTEPRVGRAAYLLGLAGLLPQLAAVALMILARNDPTDLAWIPLILGYGLALIYGSLILSFLGGIWWGYAMRRIERQGPLAIAAIVPTLVGLGCIAFATDGLPAAVSPWPAVALGCAIIATLVVDRRLVATGEAPGNWMRLRLPLSLGLGGLTIAAGLLLIV